jgi:hypothetical protein
MPPQKQFKLFQARQAFERQAAYVQKELSVCTRTDHLQPVLEFLEWLVRDMADLAGVTAEVKAAAREQAIIRAQVATRTQQLMARAPARKGPPARPVLRILKGGRK